MVESVTFFSTTNIKIRTTMNRYILLLLAVLCLAACGNKREEQKRQLRHEVRRQFYDRELVKANAQHAYTDSLLKLAEADTDTFNVDKRIRLDSLKHAADVQSAKVRFIQRKQQELKEE